MKPVFAEGLMQIGRRLDGAEALALVDGDGIVVESLDTTSDLDLEALAAELLAQVGAISRDTAELNGGEVTQFSLTTDRHTVLISTLAEGYYLLLVLAGGSSHGRARFELRRARLLFEGEFE